MEAKDPNTYKTIVKYSGIGLALAGIVMAYLYYGTEPYETISGFLCGIGFGLFLISFSVKQPKTSK